MILGTINLSKIDKSKIYVDKNGEKKLDITIVPKQTQYSDHIIFQGQTKEEREARKPGIILGNGKNVGGGSSQSAAPQQNVPGPSEADLPF